MDLDLKDKNVFISASTSGIGNAIAESFLREGCNVIINGRNNDKLEQEMHRLRSKYPNNIIYGICSDLSVEENVRLAAAYVKKVFNNIHIFVCNLGSGKFENTNVWDVSEWKRLFDVNLFSSVSMLNEFTDLFSEKGGSIAVISSLAGIDRISAPPAYAASKAALNTLVLYAAGVLADKNIRINAVAPGNVYFEGGRWQELEKENPSGTRSYINSEVPMKRFGTPEEIADMVVFLCSERSSFTTGTVVSVDGGQNR